MHPMVEIALADPVFDPVRQMTTKFFHFERLYAIGVTCNIGLE